jgi:hypothetical protein
VLYSITLLCNQTLGLSPVPVRIFDYINIVYLITHCDIFVVNFVETFDVSLMFRKIYSVLDLIEDIRTYLISAISGGKIKAVVLVQICSFSQHLTKIVAFVKASHRFGRRRSLQNNGCVFCYLAHTESYQSSFQAKNCRQCAAHCLQILNMTCRTRGWRVRWHLKGRGDGVCGSFHNN